MLTGTMERRKRYKDQKPFYQRRLEIVYIRARYPTKIPVILQRYKKECKLPELEKIKYLVPQEMTLSQFVLVVRSRLRVHSSQAIFVTVARKHLPTMTLTMQEIYNSYADEDGFLYVDYASEEVFG